ncbi:DUF6153 family protein [Microbacterium esteraromaticum]|uniref:DUF6153 family protein n=1 Tax=Microbacterium esteraromaticum TaxID=57043 RepID=UPI00195C2D82|nr:DUF6153 family protein [Microbacterium esteraromaticum]MBM7466336.1 hypothetical protein [Microbacterium esteraromaticum]
MQHRGHVWTLAVVLGILLGLLGMHTLSGDAMGHGPGTPVSAAHASGTSPHDSAATAPDGSSEASATAASESPVHPGMLSACVLVLLAALPLIVPPSASLGLRPRLQRMPGGMACLSRAAAPRPPSHIVLCISRT